MTLLARELRLRGISEDRIAVRVWRRKHKVPAVELARVAGMHKDTLHRYEMGLLALSPVRLERLHAAMVLLAGPTQ